jgi:hypothetical protein
MEQKGIRSQDRRDQRKANGPSPTIYLTDCVELNGDCPSQVTRLCVSRFARLQGLELLLAGCLKHFLSGNVPTNPCPLLYTALAFLAEREIACFGPYTTYVVAHRADKSSDHIV